MPISPCDPEEPVSRVGPLIEYVTLPNCPDCVRFEQLWAQVSPDFPRIASHAVPADSARGHELSIGRGRLRFPIIVLDGKVIAIESISEDELRRSLAVGAPVRRNG